MNEEKELLNKRINLEMSENCGFWKKDIANILHSNEMTLHALSFETEKEKKN